MSRPTAAFFDLDKTIIAKSSTLAFSKPFQAGGLISRRAVLRSAYAQFVYLVGGADHDQMEKMRQFMSQLCAGWDVATVREIVADTLHNIVDPLVYDEAVGLIEEHHLAGRDVVVVSASGAEVVEPIAEMLGADRVIATRMEIEDGRYTGEIEYYAYAEEKARAIEELAAEIGYDLDNSYAYSDSVTDVPMLEVVGHAHAVNPDKELRRVAGGEGLAGAGLHQAGRAPVPGAAAAGEADPGRTRGRRRGRGRRRAVGQRPQAPPRRLTRWQTVRNVPPAGCRRRDLASVHGTHSPDDRGPAGLDVRPGRRPGHPARRPPAHRQPRGRARGRPTTRCASASAATPTGSSSTSPGALPTAATSLPSSSACHRDQPEAIWPGATPDSPDGRKSTLEGLGEEAYTGEQELHRSST